MQVKLDAILLRRISSDVDNFADVGIHWIFSRERKLLRCCVWPQILRSIALLLSRDNHPEHFALNHVLHLRCDDFKSLKWSTFLCQNLLFAELEFVSLLDWIFLYFDIFTTLCMYLSFSRETDHFLIFSLLDPLKKRKRLQVLKTRFRCESDELFEIQALIARLLPSLLWLERRETQNRNVFICRCGRRILCVLLWIWYVLSNCADSLWLEISKPAVLAI